ncbi:Uncharacterized conserved protein YkwD, contains CAP (CSP/antigen 5/PR1) domain [Klenkia soli]|uniref:Uncharacterized conserved protein YkwD, contains CAP (CSP/antigen 5/PR1) domain n=1 Tax=Klenkia soli TaxID=1052260 RepID=A0A1H0J0C5_9ACTN|nr:CAP domain-containing protein [Klenkia soli]SDO37155.1 Uncharacterized conserved protein YkwD, contains CAP (CSP/antigen 5/PR1) domain [Klenkia soli]
MTAAGPPRRLRERLRSRPWVPLVAVLAVLAVVAGGLWLLPGPTDPVPAAATTAPSSSTSTSATTATTTAPTPTPTPTPTEAPVTTTEPVPTTPAPPQTAQAPVTAPPPAPAAAPAAPGPEGEVLALVNTERAAAGCGPVVADEGLAGVARAHSADMRDRGYFSHTSPDGQSPFDRAAAAGVSGARAENIAQGYADAASVMAGWMDSPGHRANILDCSLTRLGVGVADGDGGPWWTQLFGS